MLSTCIACDELQALRTCNCPVCFIILVHDLIGKVLHRVLIQDRRIRGLLEGCSLEHDARMDALHGRVRERVQSDARWKQLQRESNKAVCDVLKYVSAFWPVWIILDFPLSQSRPTY